MRIPISPIKQISPKGCWLATIQMILNYYGISFTEKEIDRFVIKDSEGNSFLTETGRFAKNKGLNVDCFAYNLFIISPNDSNIPREELLKKLQSFQETLKDKWVESLLLSTIKCIEQGVNYIIKKPKNPALFIGYLNRGIPLIVTVNHLALFEKQGDIWEGHEIVLTGEENNKIYFIDPVHGYEESIGIEDFMFAFLQRKIIQASAYMLALTK